MTTTARIEIKTPKVQLKLNHVLYLRSLTGEKVSCSIGSEERARLQLLDLIEEKEVEPTTEAKHQHAAKLKQLRAAVDKAYRDERWDELQNAARSLSYAGPAPITSKKFVLTQQGKQLLKDGGVTIAIKNGCGS